MNDRHLLKVNDWLYIYKGWEIERLYPSVTYWWVGRRKVAHLPGDYNYRSYPSLLQAIAWVDQYEDSRSK